MYMPLFSFKTLDIAACDTLYLPRLKRAH